MRVASGIVVTIAASLGMFKGSGYFFMAIWMVSRRLTQGRSLSSFGLFSLTTEGGMVAFCIVGLVGVLFLFDRRLQVAALLMLASALGVTATGVAYCLLFRSTQPPDVQDVLPAIPSIGFFVPWLVLVPFLIVGAALAFQAGRQDRVTEEAT